MSSSAVFFSCRDCKMSSKSPLHNKQHITEGHEYRSTASHETANQVATTVLQYVLLPNSMPLLHRPHPTLHIPNPALTKVALYSGPPKANEPTIFVSRSGPLLSSSLSFYRSNPYQVPSHSRTPPAPGSRMTITLALAFASLCIYSNSLSAR
ncbi:hypothetical protein BJV78DRAFT_1260862 [Lactifluus subvellereus]|nr:hypothetical protein BJV78DRAFT_1260862 [Lactifluus subvellereus]